ncbi:DUF2905 domain-containing protein [Virgibacillus sp. JSM 102003]|uniref:DUF2905 domain-containing protein n=1 Tax=Virgibacillus sp. JSM 102003 TaxID=1562108 RepID=UPI0035C0454D
MMNAGKLFIILGIVFVVIGLIWTFIGRLPGDISFKKGNFSFHFPIMTSIVVSIILTLIFYIMGKFR